MKAVVNPETFSQFALLAYESVPTEDTLKALLLQLDRATSDLVVLRNKADPALNLAAWDEQFAAFEQRVARYREVFDQETVQGLIYGDLEYPPDTATPWILFNDLAAALPRALTPFEYIQQLVRDNIDVYAVQFSNLANAVSKAYEPVTVAAEGMRDAAIQVVKGEIKARAKSRAIGTALGVAAGITVVGLIFFLKD